MKVQLTQTDRNALREAAAQLQEAARAKKCWPCGCLHSAVTTLETAYPREQRLPEFDAALTLAKERLTLIRYDCIGCEVCYPVVAINALVGSGGSSLVAIEACATGTVEKRPGWPPLPGDYTVLAYRAPVAVCSLTDSGLVSALARERVPEIGIVGTLQTENLGIERVISNVISNPNIRFLILCGPDSRQTVGHLPGQSLLALARHGVDESLRIRKAQGKRPVLRNIVPDVIEHFRSFHDPSDQDGGCRRIYALANQAEQQLSGKIEVRRLDITRAKDLVARLKVRLLPTIVVLSPSGSVEERFEGEGEETEERIRRCLERLKGTRP